MGDNIMIGEAEIDWWLEESLDDSTVRIGCERAGDENAPEGVLVRYYGKEYRAVLGPPYFIEQRDGAMMGSGMPSIDLSDPETGEKCYGLTCEAPEAPLRQGQVLVCGGEEGLRALSEAGIVRFTGHNYRSKRYGCTLAVCDLLVGPFRRRTPFGTP